MVHIVLGKAFSLRHQCFHASFVFDLQHLFPRRKIPRTRCRSRRSEERSAGKKVETFSWLLLSSGGLRRCCCGALHVQKDRTRPKARRISAFHG